jgi:hypothetical protein
MNALPVTDVADFELNSVVGAPFRQDACDIGCEDFETHLDAKFERSRLSKKQVEDDKRARRQVVTWVHRL